MTLLQALIPSATDLAHFQEWTTALFVVFLVGAILGSGFVRLFDAIEDWRNARWVRRHPIRPIGEFEERRRLNAAAMGRER